MVKNQLFLANNDIVELGWLEWEYYSTGKTKWDGVLFHTNDLTISPGFVEFSGGVKDNTALTKERRDVSKLYTKMISLKNRILTMWWSMFFAYDSMVIFFLIE